MCCILFRKLGYYIYVILVGNFDIDKILEMLCLYFKYYLKWLKNIIYIYMYVIDWYILLYIWKNRKLREGIENGIDCLLLWLFVCL